MTGFIRELFRSKPKSENIEVQQNGAQAPKQKSDAYYLTPDDAKTFGDIDYMRMAKSVRRTFPKEKMGKNNAFVQSVSALEKATGESYTSLAQGNQSSAQTNQEVAERRRTDTNLDMFRNMARDIRKR